MSNAVLLLCVRCLIHRDVGLCTPCCGSYLCSFCARIHLSDSRPCSTCGRKRFSNSDDSPELAKSNRNLVKLVTPMNLCYVQRINSIGLASYHFRDDDQDGKKFGASFIAYAHGVIPPGWVLGDGTPPPSKKYFENPKFNLETRTFTGTVTWPVNFNGDSRWEYRMVFSDDFCAISAGEVNSLDNLGNRHSHSYNMRQGFGLSYWIQPDDGFHQVVMNRVEIVQAMIVLCLVWYRKPINTTGNDVVKKNKVVGLHSLPFELIKEIKFMLDIIY